MIHTFWHNGESNMPPLEQSCVASWRHHLETDVRVCDLAMLMELIGDDDDLRRAVAAASYQMQADVARLLLLVKYGGVWMDAAIFVRGQIDLSTGEADLVGYQYPHGGWAKSNDLVLTNWWLAVRAPQLPIVTAWATAYTTIVKEAHVRGHHNKYHKLGVAWNNDALIIMQSPLWRKYHYKVLGGQYLAMHVAFAATWDNLTQADRSRIVARDPTPVLFSENTTTEDAVLVKFTKKHRDAFLKRRRPAFLINEIEAYQQYCIAPNLSSEWWVLGVVLAVLAAVFVAIIVVAASP